MPTCTASISCCPTSRTCASTPTTSSASSPRTATRITSVASSTCCAIATASATSATTPLPVYGAALTLGLARNRIEEAGLLGRIDMRPVKDLEVVTIGPFDVEFIPVTHSVPHAHAIAVGTAQGIVLHSGDWKLDLDPVDGRRTELSRLGQLTAGKGVRLLMADSTNAEEPGYAPSETSVGPVLRGAVRRASWSTHRHGQLRQSPPPHPADRRRGDRRRSQGRHARAEHEEERAARPRPRRAAHPRVVADRHRVHRPTTSRVRSA